MTKFLRRLWHHLTQSWHEHLCPCGDVWWCAQTDCDTSSLCASCEGARMESWILEFEMRQRRRGLTHESQQSAR